MTNSLEYLAAAAINGMRSNPTVDISSLKVMQDVFRSKFRVDLPDQYADIVARRLEQLGFLTRVSDQYAGTYFVPATSLNILLKISAIAKNNPDSQLAKALEGGDRLLLRVFKNDQFWTDLASEVTGEGSLRESDELPEESDIPASDRIVTLSHNQQVALEETSSNLIDELSKENAIDGDVSLRATMLGQVKAGRELIRAQSFRAFLLYETIMSVLGGLIERYQGQAIGVAAKKLLELLIEHVFGK